MKDNILYRKLVINNQCSSQGWAVAQGHSSFRDSTSPTTNYLTEWGSQSE